MKCILHIGTEKTGTTSIQSFLDTNRDLLKNEARTLYTKSMGTQNNRGLSFFGYNPDQVDDFTMMAGLLTPKLRTEYKSTLFDSLMQELDANSKSIDQVIFSSEHLQSRLKTEMHVLRLKNTLEKLNLSVDKIVVYIRNPLDTALSLYSTAIKFGLHGNMSLLMQDAGTHLICNHQQTIARWGSVFGLDKIVPRLYQNTAFYENNLIKDFIRTVDLPSDLNYEFPNKENPSLDSVGADLLNRINAKIPLFINDRINVKRSDIDQFFSKYPLSRKKISSSPGIEEQYRSMFEKSNEWVRLNYFPELTTLFGNEVKHESHSAELSMDMLASLIAEMWLAKQDEIISLRNMLLDSPNNIQ